MGLDIYNAYGEGHIQGQIDAYNNVISRIEHGLCQFCEYNDKPGECESKCFEENKVEQTFKNIIIGMRDNL